MRYCCTKAVGQMDIVYEDIHHDFLLSLYCAAQHSMSAQGSHFWSVFQTNLLKQVTAWSLSSRWAFRAQSLWWKDS